MSPPYKIIYILDTFILINMFVPAYGLSLNKAGCSRITMCGRGGEKDAQADGVARAIEDIDFRWKPIIK